MNGEEIVMPKIKINMSDNPIEKELEQPEKTQLLRDPMEIAETINIFD